MYQHPAARVEQLHETLWRQNDGSEPEPSNKFLKADMENLRGRNGDWGEDRKR
jgi:hypothetical protein